MSFESWKGYLTAEELGRVALSDFSVTPKLEDVVNKPSHYKGDGIECIEAIRSALTEEEFRGFCKGNVIKYTWRERLKGGVQSLHKALWYLKELTKDK